MPRLAWAIALAMAIMGVESSASAAVVELVLVPCTPGMKPEDCGLKAKLVEGEAQIETPNGTIDLNTANTVITINGNGVASPPTSSPDSILSFASAGEITTASTGPGGGGGGGGGGSNPPPSGGPNAGSPPGATPPNPPANSPPPVTNPGSPSAAPNPVSP
jgi:hypothetical protein